MGLEAMSEKKMDSISCNDGARYGPVSIRLRFVKEYNEKLGTRQWCVYRRLPQIMEPATPLMSDAHRGRGKESGGDSCKSGREPLFFRLFGVDIPLHQNQETHEIKEKASRKINPNHKSDDSVPKKPRILKFVSSSTKHPY